MASTNILRHIRNYSSAGTLSAAAGIVTFPLLTRNLSVEEYGILGLVMGTLTLFVAVGKLGYQHSVIRFYAQITHSKSEWSPLQMNSTVLVVFAILAALTSIIWLTVGPLIVLGPDYQGDFTALFALAAVNLFIKLFGSALLNFMRAQERSGNVASVQIINRYVYIAFLVGVLFFSGLSPYKVIACTLLAEVIAFGFTLYFSKKITFSLKSFKASLASAMLVYGLPLMVMETLGVALRLVDRYLISHMLGKEELGMYSASYNLTSYLELIVLATIAHALRPIYMKLWERDGAEPTREFLSSTFKIYLALGIPMVAIFSATAPHLLNFLASPKFAPGTVIIPFITLSFMLDGAIHWLAAGLYIKRNTRTLMIWGVIAMILNILLNMIFIPLYGILGASIVTVISIGVFMAGVTRDALQYLKFDIEWKQPALITLMSLGVYFLLMRLDFGSDLINLFAKGAVGCSLCLVFLIAIDTRLSDQLFGMARSRFGKSA